MSTSTSLPGGQAPESASVDKERRNAVIVTCAVGGVGVAAIAAPFLSSFAPSERAKAAGAPVEVDLSSIPLGEKIVVEWRGLPVWILRRTPEMLQSVKKADPEVADPKSQRTQYPTPEYARNEYRSIKPEFLITVASARTSAARRPARSRPARARCLATIPVSSAHATVRHSTWRAACSRTSRRRTTFRCRLTSTFPTPSC